MKNGGIQLLSGGGEANLEMWHDPLLLGLSQLACLEELPRAWGWGMVSAKRVVLAVLARLVEIEEAKGVGKRVFMERWVDLG